MANKIMHHMIHGDDTFEIVDSAARKVTLSEPVNVLSLGVKNDGSADCSSIINAATENYELYFPSGAYRVDNPLYIKKSIYGSGASRDFQRRNVTSGARLVSYIDATSSSSNRVAVLNLTYSATDVYGIGVVCYSNEDGIYFNPPRGSEEVKIQNVTVWNVGNAAGLRIDPAYSDSRAVYIDNCTVFGQGAESNSIGIIFNNGSFDSLVSNCELMGVHKGIVSYVTAIRLSNVHIWTGLLGDQTPDSWWGSTVGLQLYNETHGTNVYVDSAHVAFGVETIRPVVFDNVVVWNDNSMDGSSLYDQTIFYANPSFINNCHIIVNGCVIYDAGRIKFLVTPAVRNSPSRFRDVVVYSDKENVPTDRVMGHVGRLYFSDEFIAVVPSGNYTEVANIAAQYGGTVEIDCSLDNNRSIVEYANSGTRFSIVNKRGNLRLFYKQYSDSSGTSCYKVYVYNHTSNQEVSRIKRFCSGNAYMTSYSTMDSTNKERIGPEVLTSDDGLTEITAS